MRKIETLEQIAEAQKVTELLILRYQKTHDKGWLDTAMIMKETITNLKQCLI